MRHTQFTLNGSLSAFSESDLQGFTCCNSAPEPVHSLVLTHYVSYWLEVYAAFGFMAGYTDFLAARTHSSVFLSVIKDDNCQALDNEHDLFFSSDAPSFVPLQKLVSAGGD